MITETPPPRSRRALLTAAISAGVATLAAAVARPLPTQAADGEPVLVGGEYIASSPTKFDARSTKSPALWGISAGSAAVIGANATNGVGVLGTSSSNIGVDGVSPSNVGVRGMSGTSAGIMGLSGDGGTLPPLRTGVYGYAAQDATARGVYGRSTAGRGVYGQATSGEGVRGYATSGIAVYAVSADPMVGSALRVVGRVRLDKNAGVATIASGTNSIVVTPGIDLVSTAAVVATLQGNAGGTTTVHRVAVNTTANTFTIYLTANSTFNVKVAWHVFG